MASKYTFTKPNPADMFFEIKRDGATVGFMRKDGVDTLTEQHPWKVWSAKFRNGVAVCDEFKGHADRKEDAVGLLR